MALLPGSQPFLTGSFGQLFVNGLRRATAILTRMDGKRKAHGKRFAKGTFKVAHRPCLFLESKVKSAWLAVPKAGLRTYGPPTGRYFPAIRHGQCFCCDVRSQIPLRDSPGIKPGSLLIAPVGRTSEALSIAG
jgi:hypothetical protein